MQAEAVLSPSPQSETVPQAPAAPWLGALRTASAPHPHTRLQLANGASSFDLIAPQSSSALSYAKSGAVAASFDGVLYNAAALRQRLEVDSTSPAELLLAAYRCWGTALLEQLQGIFAFSLWDANRNRLLCARDRVGVYPLFYLAQENDFFWATSVEALTSLSGQQQQLNRDLLTAYLIRQPSRLDETFFEGVHRLPPGHALELQEGRRHVWRYWQPAAPGVGAPWVKEDELGQFSDLLEQAVSRALAHGPAGIYLSGGLDSVSVAAVAAEQSRQQGYPLPQALSLAFPGDVSEADVQAGVAKTLGLPHLLLPFEEALSGQSLVASALELSRSWHAPLQNVWSPAYQRLGQEGRACGCRVILTGGGGDEWLTVTPLIAADLIKSLRPLELLAYLQMLRRSVKMPSRALYRNVLWSNGLSPLLKDAYRSMYRTFARANWEVRQAEAIQLHLENLPSWLAPDPSLRKSLEQRIEARLLERSQKRAPGAGGYYFREMQESINHPLFALDVEELFESGRRLGMFEYNIYWDAELIEFLYRVPPKLLNQGGRSKGLVRRELAQRFPGLGFDRQKKLVSLNFFRSTVLRDSKQAWQQLGSLEALGTLGVVEPGALGHEVETILASGASSRVDQLWHILSLETWLRSRL